MLSLWAVAAAAVSAFSPTATASGTSYAAVLLAMATLGVLITRRAPHNTVGWLFCATPRGWGLRDIAEGSSAFSVTLSTLVAAAAFQPLRSRIQRVVDHRFYRARYDAVGTLDAFSGRLRKQIDLDALCDELVEVVPGTVRPAHASIWLRTVTIPERLSGTP